MTLREAYEAVQDELTDVDKDAGDIAEGDLLRADRHLRAIARIEYDRDDFVQVAEAEIAQLQEAVREVKASAAEQLDYHRGLLERFHVAVLAKFPNRLSIKLPGGTLKSTAQQPEWEWEDDGKVFRDWCKANGREELLAFPPPPEAKVKVVDAKAALTLPIVDESGKEVGREFGKFVDGTEPPGVKVIERGRKYEAKPKSRPS